MLPLCEFVARRLAATLKFKWQLVKSMSCNFPRNVVAAVGVLVATKLGVSLVRATWQCCRAYLLAPLGIGQANFLKYGKWAGNLREGAVHLLYLLFCLYLIVCC